MIAAAAKPTRAPENKPEPIPLPAALKRQETPEATEPKGPVVCPDDLNEFQNWLATGADVPGSQWDARRVLPVGEAGAPLMLLTAWPEIDDQQSGALFSGAAGQFLDAMLRELGRASGRVRVGQYV